jgi:hypothetical protein
MIRPPKPDWLASSGRIRNWGDSGHAGRLVGKAGAELADYSSFRPETLITFAPLLGFISNRLSEFVRRSPATTIVALSFIYPLAQILPRVTID